jgi:two-component system, chemotaxis family, chemotaxis protein CheY
MQKALVLDDSPIVRSIVVKLLGSWKFCTFEAESVDEALRILESESDISLFLVDWRMPGRTGLEFVEIVRANPTHSQARILMVTSETERAAVERALEAGADEYIMIPFTKEIFDEKLRLLGLEAPETKTESMRRE